MSSRYSDVSLASSQPYWMNESPILSVLMLETEEVQQVECRVKTICGTSEALARIGIESFEVLVVGSSFDVESARALSSMPNTRVVRHLGGDGYGAKIKTGLRHAKGEILLILDEVQDCRPGPIVGLVRNLLEEDADLVVASYRPESRRSSVRRLLGYIWEGFLDMAGVVRVDDPGSGMQALRRRTLPMLSPLPDGSDFQTVISTRALREGLKVVGVPIPSQNELPLLSLAAAKIRLLKSLLQTSLEYDPARILGFLGVITLALSASAGIGWMVLRSLEVSRSGPFGAFVLVGSMVAALAGVSVISLGITLNYLVQLFHYRPAESSIFGPSRDRKFGWMGVTVAIAGLVLGGLGSILWFLGSKITIWLWLLASAFLVQAGIQLVLFWILMRVLEALSEREVAKTCCQTVSH
jgi:hypothetical protein